MSGHVWRVSVPVLNVSGCVWMCLEHVWTVSRLCLEHVHTFCGPCSEHVWTVTGPWCPCLDNGLCMCMDQFGPCLDRVLTLLWPCMDCVWISSIQCRNVSLRCLKPVWTLSISQTASPPTSLGAKIHLGKCIYCQNPNHNLNTTQDNLNCSWVWCDYDCSHPTTTTTHTGTLQPSLDSLQGRLNQTNLRQSS